MTENETDSSSNSNSPEQTKDEREQDIKQQQMFVKVKIDTIKINARLRTTDASKVILIAESYKKIGQLNPIILSKDLNPIAGLHRLEAAKLLGWTEIDANIVELDEVDSEIAEIDENLMRSELHYIERGDHFRRRKELHELKYPETKQYVAGGKARQETASEIISFAESIAQKLNISERTIQQEIQIAENLTPDVKKLVIEHDIPKTEALMLIRLESEKQIEAMQKIANGECNSLKIAIKNINAPITKAQAQALSYAENEILQLVKNQHRWTDEQLKSLNKITKTILGDRVKSQSYCEEQLPDTETTLADTILKAIREHCLKCCSGSECVANNCNLYPYRMGTAPASEPETIEPAPPASSEDPATSETPTGILTDANLNDNEISTEIFVDGDGPKFDKGFTIEEILEREKQKKQEEL